MLHFISGEKRSRCPSINVSWRNATVIALIMVTNCYPVEAAFLPAHLSGEKRAARGNPTIRNRQECKYIDSCFSSVVSLKDTNTGGGNVAASEINNADEEQTSDRSKKKWISVSVSQDMPFSPEIAFDTFSDLSRQPQWSPWLKSVIYLDEVKIAGEVMEESSIPLRETEWTLGVKGFDFSWRAVGTLLDRPHRIGWKSISGIKNEGTVKFDPLSTESFDEHDTDNVEIGCTMTLEMKFVAPRVVAALFRRASFVESFFEGRLLAGTLVRFREVVLNDLQDDAVSKIVVKRETLG